MKLSKPMIAVLTVVILAVVVTAMVLVYQRYAPKPEAGGKHVTIAVTGPDGREEVHELDTDAAYLLEAVEAVAEIGGEETAQGFTLYTVNGVTADFNTDSAYWAVYVNGEYGLYSLDKQTISDGDSFALVYETY